MPTFSELERGREAVDAFERDAALSHMIRSAGDLDIVNDLLHGSLPQSEVIAGVLQQRRELALIAQQEGKPLHSYRLDFSRLGATEAQLEQIAANRAKRADLVSAVGLEPNTRDVLSENARLSAEGYAVDREGRGAHRKLIGGVEPVGRINQTGNGAELGK